MGIATKPLELGSYCLSPFLEKHGTRDGHIDKRYSIEGTKRINMLVSSVCDDDIIYVVLYQQVLVVMSLSLDAKQISNEFHGNIHFPRSNTSQAEQGVNLHISRQISEEEEPKELQGRQVKMIRYDSSVQGLVNPPQLKFNTSGRNKSIDKGRRYKRRKETKGKKVVSSLDFQEGTDAGAEQVNTPSAEQVNTVHGVNTEAALHKKSQTKQKQAHDSESQLKTYMMNYLKNQGGRWKLTQLKKLSFEEVKEEFDKLVKQVESFAPISFEAIKAQFEKILVKKLQTKTPKRLKEKNIDRAKDDDSTKKSGKREKQLAERNAYKC
ncbi:hypothetical protein Tco_0552156 [Tanacetum coccineum]